MQIKNKNKNYPLFHSGFYGNKPHTWKSYNEIQKSNFKGPVTIRGLKNIDRTKVKYYIPVGNIPVILSELKSQNLHESNLTFNESMPDQFITIQGEVMLSHRGLELLYSKEKTAMNPALKKESISIHGLLALNLLKQNLDPSSLQNLLDLLELFPDSVIEFSSFSKNVGQIKGRNTVFWEVRNY